MVRPPPEQPAESRRENTRRFLISLLPATACLCLLAVGLWPWALLIFATTFIVIGYGTVNPQSRLFSTHVSSLSEQQAREGQVWLTVDDGPDPHTTLPLLDLLDEHQAKAGFFLIGKKAAQHPELVREIARRGHLIGNHSQTHPSGSFWTLRPRRMWAEVAGCQQTLTDILGTAPVWFRPPVGHHNLFLTVPLRTLGLTMAIWNCRGFDGVVKDPKLILRLISRSLKPGSIVLLHDGTSTCIEVMKGTLRLLSERGLQAALPTSLHPAAPAPRLVES
ncbi:polysaccharide deacetylase [Prosthecobacter fusiformis]|uniref:Polysaccharide deacetylase n=1 Tax=Prosthecobacter fusiformis TaxID=48464 RepID=A0A4R7SSM1_9BACT|nr:polysaccharide deacetylase family protein [Prosthecobacter fusiformis]TDU81679.1 polysaccharide deacetylase [Prosthecobacter fusiformis]